MKSFPIIAQYIYDARYHAHHFDTKYNYTIVLSDYRPQGTVALVVI